MERTVDFKGKIVKLLGKEIKVGDIAPSFKATKNDMTEFDSSNYDDKIKVYSIVPSIDTGICSLQTKTFNSEAEKLSDDIILITISMDLPFAQGRYCGNEGIKNSILISDYREREFGMKYGFLMDEIKLLSRGVVIVDKENKVRYVEYTNAIRTEVNYEKALDELKKIK